MPLEFHCPYCGQSISAPDESAGKQIRCPGCEARIAVPGGDLTSDRQETGRHDPAPPPVIPPPAETAQRENPYLAPGSAAQAAADKPFADKGVDAELREAVFGPPVPPRHTKITFDDMLQRSWAIFTQRLGPCVLYALILIGVNLAVSAVTGVINFSTQIAARSVDALWIAFIGQGVSQIINMVFQAWITAGAIMYIVDMARYGNARFSDIFRGHPYLLRLFLFNLLVLVVVYGILGLFAVPGIVALAMKAGTEWIVAGFAPVVVIGLPLVIWLTISWYLTALLIIDRDQKLLEALGTSWRYMRGNRLIVFVGGAAVGALSLLFTLVTCGIGMLLVIPYVTLFTCVIYLLATGQGQPASAETGEWSSGGQVTR